MTRKLFAHRHFVFSLGARKGDGRGLASRRQHRPHIVDALVRRGCFAKRYRVPRALIDVACELKTLPSTFPMVAQSGEDDVSNKVYQQRFRRGAHCLSARAWASRVLAEPALSVAEGTSSPKTSRAFATTDKPRLAS